MFSYYIHIFTNSENKDFIRINFVKQNCKKDHLKHKPFVQPFTKFKDVNN